MRPRRLDAVGVAVRESARFRDRVHATQVTVHDQQSWKIPPCVSNWKNARGYTIPLDKRLAADGRGLQEQTVNNNFATLVPTRRPFPTVSELQGRVDGVVTVPRRLDVVDAAA